MAVSAIARVIMGLFKRHGVARGTSMAQKLGFRNKDIKSAYKNLKVPKSPYKKGGTFQQRKGLRELKRSARELEALETYELGGIMSGGLTSGTLNQVRRMEALLRRGQLSPRVSRAGIRRSGEDWKPSMYKDF